MMRGHMASDAEIKLASFTSSSESMGLFIGKMKGLIIIS
jgi:hypothetical protein